MRGDESGTKALHRLLERLAESTDVLHDLRHELSAYLESLEDRYRSLAHFVFRFCLIMGVGGVLAFVAVGCEVRKIDAAAGRADDRADRAARAAQRADAVAAELEVLVKRNGIAIRVGCTLLSNAIIQSGAARNGKPPKITAQTRLTALLVKSIVSQMPAVDQRRVRRLQAQVARDGGPVKLPSCDKVARDPESVIDERRP